HRSIEPRKCTGGEIGVAAARAKSDYADLASRIRLRPQKSHGAGDIAHDLRVSHSAGCAHARSEIVGAFGTFPKIQMRRDRRVTVMGQFTHDLHNPFVPSGKMMDDDDARIFARAERPCVIGLTLIAVVTAERNRLALQTTIMTHVPTPLTREDRKRFPWTALVRTAVKHRFVGHVAVDKFYCIVGPRRKGDVADQRSTGEFTFDMGHDADAVLFLVKDRADPDIGHDILRLNADLVRGWVAAIVFTGNVLSVIAREWKIVGG